MRAQRTPLPKAPGKLNGRPKPYIRSYDLPNRWIWWDEFTGMGLIKITITNFFTCFSWIFKIVCFIIDILFT